MITFNRSLRGIALAALTLTAIVWSPRPAAADDAITVVSGSNPTAFFEVLGDVAEDAGFFKAEHLAVTINYAGNPQICAQLVASGKGDMCSMGVEPIVQGYEKGLRLTAFFARDPSYQWTLGVLADSPIKTLADFKGTTIGEISAGEPAEIAANALLEGAGLKRGDVTYIPIGFGAQAIAALTSHKVAGAAFPYPELRIYEVKAGLKFRYFQHPILKDISNVAYAATPATIAAKGDLLKRFCRAIAEASIVIRVNPDYAAKSFVAHSGLKVTDDAIAAEARLLSTSEAMLPGVDPNSTHIGLMPARGMALLAKFINDNGLTTTIPPTSALVTDQFIAYANDFDHKAFIAQAKALK